MSWIEVIAILAAGFAAGAMNTVVGTGTLVTFPTLVAFGYSPVTATMSNAVGLVAGGISGAWAYRAELEGQGRRLRWQIPASLLGAVTGSLLLLHLPEKAFIKIVPVLVVLALLLVIFQTRIQRAVRARAERSGRDHTTFTSTQWALLIGGTYLVGIYGGYFTASQGTLLIGVMGTLIVENMQRLNAAKNILTLLVNIVAATMYICIAHDRIAWEAAGLIALGSLIGGAIGANVARKMSPTILRGAIVVIGVIGLIRLLMT